MFSGAGSVGKVCKDLFLEVIPLDRDMQAHVKIDIMDWGYKTYQPKHSDFIWASAPCDEYSLAKAVGT